MPNTDESLEILKDLLNEGYVEVEWEIHEHGCSKCNELHGKTWTLEEFIEHLNHEAPIFEHSHVNCICKVIVRNLEGDEIRVNWEGEQT